MEAGQAMAEDKGSPVDHAAHVITYPCFMVKSEDGTAFASHTLSGGGYMPRAGTTGRANPRG
jgi:hypothetical protein